ncbi:unnamed protein product [Paramecium sonneborni]|uniref:Uncharacterized protein n=1 Tax=Paramecium sonneborni TaxID=65129 RepID=A0A8S1RQ27_9CILI|nr:unnamed protein product [Paramecium sonneborni]
MQNKEYCSDTFINNKQCQDNNNVLSLKIEDVNKELKHANIIRSLYNKFAKRKRYLASIHYNQADCKLYGNCIGKVDGRCQETPQNCEDILKEQFCEFNYNKERCI